MKRIRKLKVLDKKKISNNLLRIILTGNDLKDFPENEKGGYVKLLFPKSKINGEEFFQRPYTIRNFRKSNLELDIDFANHTGNKGLATSWAYSVKSGESIIISGPSSKPKVKENVDWLLFVGDMSALPAISTYLEDLSKNTLGKAIIEILDKSDKIDLVKPKNFEIIWSINKGGVIENSDLVKNVYSLEWLKGTPYVWVACEFNSMKVLRNYFQSEKKINKNEMYISSYWKSGENQETHKKIKQKDNLIWNK
mgnify:FL=1